MSVLQQREDLGSPDAEKACGLGENAKQAVFAKRRLWGRNSGAFLHAETPEW